MGGEIKSFGFSAINVNMQPLSPFEAGSIVGADCAIKVLFRRLLRSPLDHKQLMDQRDKKHNYFALRWLTASCIAFWSCLVPAEQDANVFTAEYALKASYLYNLTKFVRWPAGHKPVDTIHICVLGSPAFTKQLEKLTHRKSRGKSITIDAFNDFIPDQQCQVYFVGKNKKNDAALKVVKNASPLLSIGENLEFIETGGLISLISHGDNVELAVNLTKAREQGFEISGNLLEIAKYIK